MLRLRSIKLAHILFLSIAITDILAVSSQNRLLELFCKPLLMPTLALLYLTEVKKPNFWFLSCLFFSFLGDIFLLFEKDFFILGLGMFLFTHLIYLKIVLSFLKDVKRISVVKASIPFLILFGLLLWLIAVNLGKLLVPVIVYGITICAFGTVSLLNYRHKKTTENCWLLIGSLFFIASDSGIAIYNFHHPYQALLIFIVIFYVVAQYLICKAFIYRN